MMLEWKDAVQTLASSGKCRFGGEHCTLALWAAAEVAVAQARLAIVDGKAVSNFLIPPKAWEAVTERRDHATLDPATGELRCQYLNAGGMRLIQLVAYDIQFLRLPDHLLVAAPAASQVKPKDTEKSEYEPTGDPGRRELGATLYLAEFERRAEADEIEPELIDEAKFLEQWFTKSHPHRQPPTWKTIRNRIRAPYRRACTK